MEMHGELRIAYQILSDISCISRASRALGHRVGDLPDRAHFFILPSLQSSNKHECNVHRKESAVVMNFQKFQISRINCV